MSKGGGQEKHKEREWGGQVSGGKASNADRQQFLSALRVQPTKIHSIYLTRADGSKNAEKKS